MKRVVVAVEVSESQREWIVSQVEGWAVVDFIPEQPADWEASLSDAEVVFGWPAAGALEKSSVRFFQLGSSGYDQYMTEALMKKRCFLLANARGVAAAAVAEHCLSMMFAFARQVPLHLRQQERHLWKRSSNYTLLSGSIVAIVGLGAIGGALGERCHALGMRVVAVTRNPVVPKYVTKRYALDNLGAALGESRHVALTISPFALENGPLFGAAEFNAMPADSYFYNLSRGSLVDQNALETALKEGRPAGAGLDVFVEEPLPGKSGLWDLENVLISPHAGGRYQNEIQVLVELFLNNLRQYREGKPVANLVIANS